MTEKEVYQKGVALLEEWEDVNYCEHTFKFKDDWLDDKEVVDLLNGLYEENEQLKQDVEYWKQVASQYSNELNVFEHSKRYKTECKDIYWSSDDK